MSDTTLRLVIFLGIFVGMTTAEALWPRRTPLTKRFQRWPHTLSLSVLNSLLARLVLPITLAGVSVWSGTQGWGFFVFLETPYWAAMLLSLLFLDMLIYVQHIIFHHVPFLWRLHRVHHADIDFDATTALRFHPLEIIFSLFIKAGAVIALGIPADAIFLFEIILNGCALFNHGNVRIPSGADSVLRLLFVTPDMHRVHHSVHRFETNSNYGFNLAIWDRLFGTYRAQPQDGHQAMKIGLDTFRNPREYKIDKLLTQPFRDTSE